MFFRSIFVLLFPNYNLGYCLFIKMKRITTQKKLTMRKFLLLALLLAGSSLHGFAQADCFVYEDVGKTIITGLTEEGIANIVSSQAPYSHSITIPASVKTVKVNAFSSLSSYSFSYYTLNIEDGGDPLFESASETGDVNALDEDNSNTVVQHHIYGINVGNGMSLTNLEALIRCLGTRNNLASFTIDGLSVGDIKTINWTSTDFTEVLTNDVIVTIPAGQVMPSGQSFGNAQVYGRFTLEKSLVTYSGNVTFQDTDHGSNMLFYVATNVNGNQIHVKRVDYVRAGQGILIHNATNTSTYADLPRKDGTTTSDNERYQVNKFVGMPDGGTIYATETIGNVEYTNFILSNGLFYPTETGTIRANRAFLRLTTKEWDDIKTTGSRARNVGIVFDDDETTDIETMSDVRCQMSDVWYDLSGRKIVNPSNGQMPKGIYIQNGKKYVVR